MTDLIRVQKAIAMPNGDWLVYGPDRIHRTILKEVPAHVEAAMEDDFDAFFHGTWDEKKKVWIIGAPAYVAPPKEAKARPAKGPAPEARKIIHILSPSNPRKVNSKGWHSFNLMKEGMRVSDFLSAGGRIGDIRWDLNAGHIALEEPKE
jgi:hypothetical protein